MSMDVTRPLNGRLWKPGESGNPNGRPVGSRNAFSNAFMADLASVWAEHGRAAMELTAKTMPSVFFATAARVLPKDVAISIEQSYPGGLAPDDIAILRAIKEAIPDANSRSPQEVLSFVAEAVRAHSAKTIEPSKD
jgi:hypothetical protein